MPEVPPVPARESYQGACSTALGLQPSGMRDPGCGQRLSPAWVQSPLCCWVTAKGASEFCQNSETVQTRVQKTPHRAGSASPRRRPERGAEAGLLRGPGPRLTLSVTPRLVTSMWKSDSPLQRGSTLKSSSKNLVISLRSEEVRSAGMRL